MTPSGLRGVCLPLAIGILACTPPAAEAGIHAFRTEITDMGSEAGGIHLRLLTERGPMHVWHPASYEAEGAGVVVYLHGYYTSVDQAWTEHHLAEQFQASGRNALFIVPEAPQYEDDPVQWESPDELLEAVEGFAGSPWPHASLVVIGHRGAYRTMAAWLGSGHITCLILLDALYHLEPEFHAWLHGSSNPARHQMILVGYETARTSERFTRRARGRLLARIPDDISQFSGREKQARVLYLRSQYDHMEIVTGGRVIPLLLQLASLPPA